MSCCLLEYFHFCRGDKLFHLIQVIEELELEGVLFSLSVISNKSGITLIQRNDRIPVWASWVVESR